MQLVTPHLYIPGPTNIPDAVRMAMNVPMEDMRSPEFPKFTLPIFEDLKKVFKMKDGRVFIFPSSGTGAWESAITNTLAVRRQGSDVALRPVLAALGRYGRALGLKVVLCDEEWGTGVPLEKYADILAKDKGHEIKAVFATHNETATGVTSDIAGVRKALDAAKHPACCSSTACPRSARSICAWANGASIAASRARRRASCCRPASAFSPSARRRSTPTRARTAA